MRVKLPATMGLLWHPWCKELEATTHLISLDDAWDEHPLEASDDGASVDDVIVVALNNMEGAAPASDGDPAHMDVAAPMPADVALVPFVEPIGSQGLPSAVTVVLAEGTIAWYRYTGDFVAKCRHPRHKEGRSAATIGRATLVWCL